MTPLLWTLISLQIVMGGLDTLGHHEVTERLAWRDSLAVSKKLCGLFHNAIVQKL